LKVPRGERSPDTLYVATEEEIEAGTYHTGLYQAGNLPTLQHVVCRPVVFPDTVSNEGNEKVVRASPVKIFGA